MKTLFYGLLILACALPLHADILANGDFADGTAHWSGDTSTASSDSPGLTIQLNPSKWTKVYQNFSTRETELNYTVSYTTSSDCTLTSGPEPLAGRFLSKTDIAGLIGTRVNSPINLKPQSWLLMINDPAGGELQSSNIKPPVGVTGTHVAKNTLTHLAAHEEKTLYLVFPPGEGTVTLLSIALTPTDAPAPELP